MLGTGQHDDTHIVEKQGTMRIRFKCGFFRRACHAQPDCGRQFCPIRPLSGKFAPMSLYPSAADFVSVCLPLRPQNQHWFPVDIEGER